MSINIGLSDSNRKKVAQVLNKTLTEYYGLAITTQFYHWYVSGPEFCTLHKLFGKHYDDFVKAIDTIAERIRALDEEIDIDFSPLQKFNSSQKDFSKLKDKDMLEVLVDYHEAAVKELRTSISAVEETGDSVTADFLVSRVSVHEETVWVLNSFMKPSGLR